MYIQISNVIYFYLEKEEDEPFPLMIQGNNTEVQCSMLGKISHSVAFWCSFSYSVLACYFPMM